MNETYRDAEGYPKPEDPDYHDKMMKLANAGKITGYAGIAVGHQALGGLENYPTELPGLMDTPSGFPGVGDIPYEAKVGYKNVAIGPGAMENVTTGTRSGPWGEAAKLGSLSREQILGEGWIYQEPYGLAHKYHKNFNGHSWWELSYYEKDEECEITRFRRRGREEIKCFVGNVSTLEELKTICRLVNIK